MVNLGGMVYLDAKEHPDHGVHKDRKDLAGILVNTAQEVPRAGLVRTPSTAPVQEEPWLRPRLKRVDALLKYIFLYVLSISCVI